MKWLRTSCLRPESGLLPETLSVKPPSRLLRVATFGGLWVIVGFILYATYQTDACPPEVKNREAIQAGLLAPLFLSANVSACLRGFPGELAAGLGFLSGYVVLAMVLLRSRTMTGFAMASILLTILSGLGLWGTFYSYAHSGG